jgi:hypothetical protein
LSRDLPSFPSARDIGRAGDDLRPAYETYVRDVSTAGMAASLQTTAVLLALCRRERVTSAVDVGSGFSSYALRFWAREVDCVVSSVDDDPVWLARTQKFLADQRLPTGDVYLWPDLPDRTFDLVFHDFAMGVRREEAMPRAVQASSRFVVFDDAHHRSHRRAMRAVCAEAGARLYSLRPLTLDWMKRYAMLAVK